MCRTNALIILCSDEESDHYGYIHLSEVASFRLQDKIEVICQGSMITENVLQKIAPITRSVLYGTSNGGIGIIAEVHEDYRQFLSSLQAKLKNVVRLLGGCRYENNVDFIDGNLIEKFLELERYKMQQIVADLEVYTYVLYMKLLLK